MNKRRQDERTEYGTVQAGFRLVRSGGKVKINHQWFQSERLEKYAGQYVWCDAYNLIDGTGNESIAVYRGCADLHVSADVIDYRVMPAK